jgi:signal transduction histidine kinase
MDSKKRATELDLVSNDAELHKLCREILQEFPSRLWSVSITEPGQPLNSADLYVIDYQAPMPLPPAAGKTSSYLFLVHRKDVDAFRAALGAAEAHILLKPVTRATLRAFIGLAVAAYEERLTAARVLRHDRDEILQCLLQANLKLQEYDQDRTNFLARAVHDFRAPLTAISGYCGLLLSEPLGELNEDQKEVLQRMQNSAKRLSRMAATMFQLSVGRHVQRRPDFEEASIRETVEQSLHEVWQFAEGKRITIDVDLGMETKPLFYESSQIEQVLVNLLDNACKFTPKAGQIEIRGYPFFWDRRATAVSRGFGPERRAHLSEESNSYRIDVIDSGPPIPQEHLGRIFEEYTSYSGGRDRSGGGLGLAICRLIVTQHAGHVWAENTEAGPMFSFVLPFYATKPLQSADTNQHLKYSEVSY